MKKIIGKGLTNNLKYSIIFIEKRKEVKKMKILNKVFCIICILFLLWIILSYFDVILHNLDEEPIYKFWNFFQLLVENPL